VEYGQEVSHTYDSTVLHRSGPEGDDKTMHRLERESTLPFSRDTIAAWHKQRTALQRMIPPWRRVEIEREPSPLIEGSRIGLRMQHCGFWMNWEFTLHDLQSTSGGSPWKCSSVAKGSPGCILEDRMEYGSSLDLASKVRVGRCVADELGAVFQARQVRLEEDLRRHRDEGPSAPLRVGISGSSGMIGQALSNFLETGGHEVIRIVRGRTQHHDTDVHWDPSRGLVECDRLEGLDAIVHLAGAGIAERRWDKRRKRVLRSSRVGGTLLLSNALADLEAPPKVLVSASAIGYYGNQAEAVDEGSPPGTGFLPDLCQEWEAATRTAYEAGIRVAVPRIGIVLSPKGGALANLRSPAMWGLLGPMGSGRQGMSCIGLDDLVYLLHRMIVDESMEGPYNAVCPEFMTQRVFAKTLGGVLGRPSVMPMPAPLIKAALGEMGSTLLLQGAFVKPRRMLDAGFSFSQPTVEESLRLQLGRFDAA
jgi:uncharacterized protein (TIGR01777 family)